MAHILIVDDDAAFRSSLGETLQDLGHTVLQAASTVAGLHRLRTEPVDVAIVDLRMPGEDGLAFLRKAAGISSAPCIMLTAYASGGNTIEAMRLGAFDHLTKPVGRAALVQALQRALDSAQASAAPTSVAEAAASQDDTELVSSSGAMREVFKRIGMAAAIDAPCWCWAKPARVKSWSPVPCTAPARAPHGLSWRSIALPFLQS